MQLIKAKEDLERQYNLQYMDLKEAARRLEDDLNHKLSQASSVKNELTEKIQNLQKENKRLQEQIAKQQEDYETIKKTSLNKEQTATLVHQLVCTSCYVIYIFFCLTCFCFRKQHMKSY